MNFQKDVSKIAQLKPTISPLFSVYLNTLKHSGHKSSGEVFLKKTISGLKSIYAELGYETFAVERVRQFLNNFLRSLPFKQSPGYALFVSGGRNLFEVIELPFPPENQLYCQLTPNLFPIIRFQEDVERFITVVLDIRQARILTIVLGKIADTRVLERESLNHVRRRGRLGLYKTRLERRIDKYTEQFVENVIKSVKNKTAAGGDFAFFAGDEVILPVVKDKISKLKIFDYEFLKLDIKTLDAKVLSKSLEAFRRIKREKRAERLRTFLNCLNSGQKAVSGFGKAFEAFKEDNIISVIVSLKPGYDVCFCPFCWFWEKVVRLHTCPKCNLPMEIVDYKEKVVNLVYHYKVKMEFVEDSAVFEKMGGVGAYLKK